MKSRTTKKIFNNVKFNDEHNKVGLVPNKESAVEVGLGLLGSQVDLAWSLPLFVFSFT